MSQTCCAHNELQTIAQFTVQTDTHISGSTQLTAGLSCVASSNYSRWINGNTLLVSISSSPAILGSYMPNRIVNMPHTRKIYLVWAAYLRPAPISGLFFTYSSLEMLVKFCFYNRYHCFLHVPWLDGRLKYYMCSCALSSGPIHNEIGPRWTRYDALSTSNFLPKLTAIYINILVRRTLYNRG